MRFSALFIERVLSKVEFKKANDCWLWQGALETNGYPQAGYNLNGKYIKIRVHRWLAEWVFGEPFTGAVCMHLCDNRWCLNPKHLKWGTQQENISDAVKNGRRGAGKNWYKKADVDAAWRGAEISDELRREVLRLYLEGVKCHQIALEVGCSVRSVHKVVRKEGLAGTRAPWKTSNGVAA